GLRQEEGERAVLGLAREGARPEGQGEQRDEQEHQVQQGGGGAIQGGDPPSRRARHAQLCGGNGQEREGAGSDGEPARPDGGAALAPGDQPGRARPHRAPRRRRSRRPAGTSAGGEAAAGGWETLTTRPSSSVITRSASLRSSSARWEDISTVVPPA